MAKPRAMVCPLATSTTQPDEILTGRQPAGESSSLQGEFPSPQPTPTPHALRFAAVAGGSGSCGAEKDSAVLYRIIGRIKYPTCFPSSLRNLQRGKSSKWRVGLSLRWMDSFFLVER